MNKKIMILTAATVIMLTLPAMAEFTEPDTSGLASKYPADAGIEKDPSVIFTENFEEGSIKAVTARWDEAKNSSCLSLAKDVPAGSSGKHSILFTHIEGQDSAHLYRQLLPGYDQLYLRFYTKFATDCNPIHHFLHIGGHNPPTPWAQGGAGTRPDGDKWFTTGAETCGASWHWDFYSYWMEMKACPTGKFWGNDFINDTNLTVPKGEWICVELMTQMNNPVTERNGQQTIWINGRLWKQNGQITSHVGKGFPKGKWDWDSWNPDPEGKPFEGYRWRSVKELNLNYLWLLVYMTSDKNPGHLNKVWIDDVVVAKKYIGPITAKKTGK